MLALLLSQLLALQPGLLLGQVLTQQRGLGLPKRQLHQ